MDTPNRNQFLRRQVRYNTRSKDRQNTLSSVEAPLPINGNAVFPSFGQPSHGRGSLYDVVPQRTAVSGERALDYLLHHRVGEVVKLIHGTKRPREDGSTQKTLATPQPVFMEISDEEIKVEPVENSLIRRTKRSRVDLSNDGSTQQTLRSKPVSLEISDQEIKVEAVKDSPIHRTKRENLSSDGLTEQTLPPQSVSQEISLNEIVDNVKASLSHTNQLDGPSALDYSANTEQNSWSHEPSYMKDQTVIHKLPPPAEGIEVVYTKDPVVAEAWLKNNVIACSAKAVGFDLEWKPQFVKKRWRGTEQNRTAVLQLGTDKSCLVLHLHHMRTLPKCLETVLKDKEVIKVGSAILQDVKKLKRDKDLSCHGVVDTQCMAKSCGVPKSEKVGLKALAERFLGIELDKSKSVSKSSWENFPLSLKQIEYSALDAWIGLKLFQHMENQLNSQGHVFKINEVEVQDVHKCSVCKKCFKSKKSVADHAKSHTTQKCSCGKQYRGDIPKKHKKKCRSSRPEAEFCICEACGKKCETLESLLKHISDARHVRCTICCKLLQAATYVKMHQRECTRALFQFQKTMNKDTTSN